MNKIEQEQICIAFEQLIGQMKMLLSSIGLKMLH